MRTPLLKIAAPLAAGWTLLYVASKVHFALEERLGVTGGPHVTPGSYADYGPGEVANAQWANAAVGVGGIVLLLVPLLTVRFRRTLTVLLSAFFLMAAAGAAGMLGRAVLTDSGGAGFGSYCTVWAVLIGATTLAHHRNRVPVRAG